MNDFMISNLAMSRPSIAYARKHESFEQLFSNANQKKSQSDICKNIRELNQGLSSDLYIATKNDYEDFQKCHDLADNQNDAYAQYCMGLFYYNGEECEQNIDLAWKKMIDAAERHQKKAMEWIALSDDQPDTPAVKTILAECYLYGVGYSSDRDKAIKLLREAADVAGDCFARAQNILGECMEAEQNFDETVYWYKQSVSQEYPPAEYNLALLLLQAQDENASFINQAMDLLQKSADHGDMRAQYLLGHFYETGENMSEGKSNERKAFKYYLKSANQGYSPAQNEVGECYYYGFGIAKDLDKAQEWYQKAATQDNADAQCGLGKIYIDKDYYVESVKYLQKASDQDISIAAYWLAVLYQYGSNGIEQNDDKAFRFYTKAADLGNSSAQNELADIYIEKENYDKAFYLYKQSSKQNNKDALYSLGCLYSEGKTPYKEKDDVNAFICFKESAELGLSVAKASVGYSYLSGIGTKVNVKKAIRWLKEAAKDGNSLGQANLGYCYMNGVGVEKNYNKAVRLFNKAIKEDEPIAQNNLGLCYMNGWGVEQNYNKALNLFRKAAKQSIALAISNLGYCYLNAWGVEKDYHKAVKLFKKAIKEDEPYAQTNLGWCYMNGWGVGKDYLKAVQLFKKAIKTGNPMAQNNLGLCYMNGWGINQNYDKAFYYFTQAIEFDIVQAQYNLGLMYFNGFGIEENYDEALRWFTKAAYQNLPQAQAAIGTMYLCEFGVEENDTEAFKWFSKAAEQNYPEGLDCLGECYYNGWGVDVDYQKAVELFQQAIELDNYSSYYNLACCYFYGHGVKKDIAKAKELTQKAIDNDDSIEDEERILDS